jgi:serine/threonine-protein kinase
VRVASADASDALLGKVIGRRYEIVRLIGRGGMGAVYEVRHRKLKRSFAMKVLADVSAPAHAMARFQREAHIVARLRHPHIVEVIDIETLPDGRPCMVMEYLEGEDLAARLKRGPMSWVDIAKIAEQVMSALASAHRHGIIHRDLKPANIFVARDESGEQRATLLDFGVSKIRSAEQTLTEADGLVGTPAFMSPEQAEGKSIEVDASTDVWAMAAILYEMVTGARAFAAANTPSILYRICYGAPEPMAVLRPDVPPDLVDAVNAALTRDPSKRVVDVSTLQARVRAALRPLIGFTMKLAIVADEWEEGSDATQRSKIAPAFGGDSTLSGAKGELSLDGFVPRAARRARPLAMGIGILACTIAGAAYWKTNRSPAPQPAPVAASSPKPAIVESPPPPTRRSRTVDFTTFPTRAHVTLDGLEQVSGSVTWGLDGRHALLVTAPGYADRLVRLDDKTPDPLVITLQSKQSARRPIAREPLAPAPREASASLEQRPAPAAAPAPKREGGFLSPFGGATR